MSQITEQEFAKNSCDGISEDREKICRYNPIGTEEDILLWMLLSVLISYLSLSILETPCFTGKMTAETYRQAIDFVLTDRKAEDFDTEFYLTKLCS